MSDNISAKSNEELEKGISHQQSGQLDEALACFQLSLKYDPKNVVALCNIGAILLLRGKLDVAISCLKLAISIKPEYAFAHYIMGNALTEKHQPQAAVASYQKAIEVQTDYASAYNNMGNALLSQGEMVAAAKCYQKAIDHKADFSTAYFNLSEAKEFTHISQTQAMTNLLKKESDTMGKIALNFALGKAMADLGLDSEAFAYYITGNELMRTTINFDLAKTTDEFKSYISQFNNEFFFQRKTGGCLDKTPIFILGMPRSGSTLIEQILSSHPKVYGGGEQLFLKEVLFENVTDNLDKLPQAIADMPIKSAEKLGQAYISKLCELAPESQFITDKMPNNFIYIGIIKTILPNAKIIHSVRSPTDTCLSIFQKKFSGVHNYAYDLTELGEYYNLYADLMDHWREVLPNTILDIAYEDLTKNQESQSKRILNYCNLEWNDNCLNFHQTNRNINTASNNQVRKPMYRSSVGRWHRFEAQLQPLIKALDGG
ncbi:MAG: sulfotransferase [Magnetococcales bacterium]|nr:sulfotransferase [Magnetococcales bacterium]